MAGRVVDNKVRVCASYIPTFSPRPYTRDLKDPYILNNKINKNLNYNVCLPLSSLTFLVEVAHPSHLHWFVSFLSKKHCLIVWHYEQLLMSLDRSKRFVLDFFFPFLYCLLLFRIRLNKT